MCIHTIAIIPVRQKGAVLIIGLIFLMVITLIGVTAMQRTTLDTKITGNYRSYTIAFEGNESALVSGESRLRLATTRPKIGDTQHPANPTIWPLGSPGNCTNPANNAWWFFCPFNWWQGQVGAGQAYAVPDPLFQNPSQPMYLIEPQATVKEPLDWGSYEDPQDFKDYYRITARGSTGQNSQSDVMLQSVFAWRYGP